MRSVKSQQPQQSRQRTSPALEETSETALLLLTLPCDAWHGIAGFLTAGEWNNVCVLSRGANRACRTVFRRVRMHGFRCATEVMAAWALGEHADARELAALYIKNGVPIYAPCLGHSFHTLMWRMSREAREMESSPTSTETTTTETTTPAPQDATRETPSDAPISVAEPQASTPTPPVASKPQLDRFYSERYEARDRGGYFLSSLTYLQEKCLFWRYKRDDDPNGSRRSFHPSLTPSPANRNFLLWQLPSAQQGSLLPNSSQRRQMLFRGGFPKGAMEVTVHRHLANQHTAGVTVFSDEDMIGLAEPVSLSSDFFHPTEAPVSGAGVAAGSLPMSGPGMDTPPPWDNNSDFVPEAQQEMMGPHPPTAVAPSPAMIYPLPLDSITSDVQLSMYSGTSLLPPAVRSRFDAFHQKLSLFLDANDSTAFNECLLDFWDEFLPRTAGIHFFDKHTPVPRLGRLSSFLTEPCPKAIGIVQCEIERIRSSGSKGKSVKGRLFPTYEYRLFIRDRRASEGIDCQRKDTILMTAKNRGKNYHGAGHKGATGASAKRGVNNYYLYMADNDLIKSQTGFTSSEPPNEMGRLQSNFIGTEFQIFRPSATTPTTIPTPAPPSSESDNDTDNDTTTRQQKLTRVPSKRLDTKTSTTASMPVTETETDESSGNQKKSKRKSRRRKGTIPFPSLNSRSRRAIANNDDPPSDNDHTASPSCHEDEDGAITYTANLLGNRPRVMDVCIPKINEDGSECEWRRYIRTNPGVDGNRMLSRFKQLQERLNNHEQQQGANQDGDAAAGDEGAAPTPGDFGLLALQNRPPWWNIELGAFVLNFGGRVSVASVKNFQLCDRNDQDYIMLQFGRIQGRHSFTMDFQYPLTAVQAFAIAISSLQSKISLG
mmetsp:Transcript_25248/g.30517  ORF Transcript_25248/g.30517 Transcript_25248/m.30517 type:complete len:884 (+) Transcript_25248:485-3136(+)